MGHEVTRPRKKLLWAGAIALALAAAASITYFTIGGSAGGSKVDSAIAASAPADSDTFIVAPYTSTWWDKVTAFDDPGKGLGRIDPQEAPAPIKAIGYSRSADIVERENPLAGPLRVLYMETETEEEAVEVSEWLGEASKGSGFVVHKHGPVLALTSGWVKEYPVPTAPLKKVKGFKAPLTKKAASMWMNPEKEVASLANEKTAEPYAKILASALGFERGTTWVGESEDGDSWQGRFATGGVNQELLDYEAATAEMRRTEVVISSIEGPNVKSEIILPGLAGLLSSAHFENGKETLGSNLFKSTKPADEKLLVSVTNDVTDWDSALRGIDGVRENVLTRTMSMNEDEMNVSFTFATDK